jgi:cytochrome c-type biogenesis protein
MSFLDNIEQIITLYPLVAFGAVFLAGVVSSASPCVLATIPLVVGFVGGYSDGDRGKAFRYSLAFILGLSLTFTAFGAAAGLLGTMFGTMGGKWYIIAGAVALVMGGQLMGLYEIHLPIRRDFKPKQGGIVGAFLLGLFFGVVSSPCATPVLVVLLTLVAGKGQVLYGIALLFSYAIGHCLLMLFAGTFTGFVEGFVKARGVVNFSIWAKRVSGLIVALVGGWFFWQGLGI